METEDRRFKALDVLLDYSKGTLWWVKDRLWNEAIPGFVMKRKGHPGLSLSRRKSAGLYDLVPMAIGVTKTVKDGLAVRNISEQSVSGKDRLTHFAVLRPCRIRFNDFGMADGVSPNAYKPRLDRSESARLDKILFGGR